MHGLTQVVGHRDGEHDVTDRAVAARHPVGDERQSGDEARGEQSPSRHLPHRGADPCPGAAAHRLVPGLPLEPGQLGSGSGHSQFLARRGRGRQLEQMPLQPERLRRRRLRLLHRPQAALVEPQRYGGEGEQEQQPGVHGAQQHQRDDHFHDVEHRVNRGPQAVGDTPGGVADDGDAVQEVRTLQVVQALDGGDVPVDLLQEVGQPDLFHQQDPQAPRRAAQEGGDTVGERRTQGGCHGLARVVGEGRVDGLAQAESGGGDGGDGGRPGRQQAPDQPWLLPPGQPEEFGPQAQIALHSSSPSSMRSSKPATKRSAWMANISA